jgi:short subunit dehydrogenase-like uncharacterized protein
MPATDREYDIVVWGATGVAGGLVAEFLIEQYAPADLSLAIAGRNREKLESIESDLTSDGNWAELPIVIADATESESLREMAEQTAVVCSTVGPYTKYGSPLVEACVESETDYCDLTGEINWIRESIDRFHEDAVDSETRIVHSCGFDSIPADLGTLLVQDFADAEFDTHCDVVGIYLEEGSGGVSGGTLASIAELFDAASSDPVARETLRNPYSLAPSGERDGVDRGQQRLPRKDRLRGEWTGPSPMAAVNERIIRRSHALLEYPWGRDFRCRESLPTGSGPLGAVGAGLVSGGVGAFTGAMSIGPVRSAVSQFVFPDPGEGPSESQMERGHFQVRVLGQGTASAGSFTVSAAIGSDWDPGYGATARMLGESAMCLFEDDTETPLDGGVLTPASGIGTPLADRLRDVGFTITVEDATGTGNN